ncbi:restriction endonuclease [Rhodococcus sp. PvR044]|uniref:McrC family protein n=1 Tax=Rhodococcus sp. PvR044 TaxID=3156402 RepID=UPI0033968370
MVTITPTIIPGRFALTAAKKIGAVSVGDLQVLVEPKVPINRLLWLMGYVNDPSFWTTQTVALDSQAELVPALAEAFTRAAERAMETGLLRGYCTVEESSAVLRGRLRAGEQLSRRFGIALPLEVRYDEYSPDIAENQLLLAATLTLLRMPRIPHRTRTKLLGVRRTLAEITPPIPGTESRWIPTRLNARYHWALQLADLVLANQSVEQRIGDVTVSGFVVDMWSVYEDFLMTALGEQIAKNGGRGARPRRPEPRRFLDQKRTVTIEPDLTWYDAEGRPETVIDAKYKIQRNGVPNADVYQLVAYCTALGLSHGHLVYAQGTATPTSVKVVGANITISCHSVDLALPPDQLLASIAVLTDRILINC